MTVRVAVLISGSGTNLQALIDATSDDNPAMIALVVADRHKALGLQRARDAGIPTAVILKRDHDSRERYDEALVQVLRKHEIEWVALAGFMRLVTPILLDAFPWRVLNIHPALLPAFPGLHGQRQAFEYGVKISGATVHFVDTGTDTGPIIAQGAVPLLAGDDEDRARARILRIEHQLYPMVLRWAAEGRLAVTNRNVTVIGDLPTFLWSDSV